MIFESPFAVSYKYREQAISSAADATIEQTLSAHTPPPTSRAKLARFEALNSWARAIYGAKGIEGSNVLRPRSFCSRLLT